MLDMGEPVRIVDLARDLIRLSGLEPDRDIEIRFTGLRPGEKLFEELFLENESYSRTRHEKIFVCQNGQEIVGYRVRIADCIDALVNAAQRGDAASCAAGWASWCRSIRGKTRRHGDGYRDSRWEAYDESGEARTALWGSPGGRFIWVYSKLVRDMAYYRCQDDQPFNTGAEPCLITQMPLYTSFMSNSNLC